MRQLRRGRDSGLLSSVVVRRFSRVSPCGPGDRPDARDRVLRIAADAVPARTRQLDHSVPRHFHHRPQRPDPVAVGPRGGGGRDDQLQAVSRPAGLRLGVQAAVAAARVGGHRDAGGVLPDLCVARRRQPDAAGAQYAVFCAIHQDLYLGADLLFEQLRAVRRVRHGALSHSRFRPVDLFRTAGRRNSDRDPRQPAAGGALPRRRVGAARSLADATDFAASARRFADHQLTGRLHPDVPDLHAVPGEMGTAGPDRRADRRLSALHLVRP